MRKLIALPIVLGLLLLAFVLPALAQSVLPPDTTVDLGAPALELAGIVVSIAISLGFLVLLWLARMLKQKTGIDIEARLLEIEARHRETLHSAVMTWAKAAEAKFGPNLKFDVGSPQAKFIIDGILKSAGDAAAALKPTEEWILSAAAAKLGLTP